MSNIDSPIYVVVGGGNNRPRSIYSDLNRAASDCLAGDGDDYLLVITHAEKVDMESVIAYANARAP